MTRLSDLRGQMRPEWTGDTVADRYRRYPGSDHSRSGIPFRPRRPAIWDMSVHLSWTKQPAARITRGQVGPVATGHANFDLRQATETETRCSIGTVGGGDVARPRSFRRIGGGGDRYAVSTHSVAAHRRLLLLVPVTGDLRYRLRDGRAEIDGRLTADLAEVDSDSGRRRCCRPCSTDRQPCGDRVTVRDGQLGAHEAALSVVATIDYGRTVCIAGQEIKILPRARYRRRAASASGGQRPVTADDLAAARSG